MRIVAAVTGMAVTWGRRLGDVMDREISDAIGPRNVNQLSGLTHQLRNALGGFTPGNEIKEDGASTPSSKRKLLTKK